ncbi:MAG: DUF4856 domain-containing protein [Bacteroidia bacterium]|nr:DUF4856 domain-containing protein [Bacteroidia bacterium]MDW8300857.1 hypothetical protein [Bacteroidia bacterium]
MKRIYFSFKLPIVVLTIVLGVSCKKDELRPALVIPTTYESADFNTNASTQIAVVNQLVALTEEAKKGRVQGMIVTKTALDNLFNAGNPSLASLITPYFKSRLEGTGGWFDELAKASGGTYTPGPPTGQGGVFGTGSSAYLFDENGLELEQLIEKGQFGATLYKHATDLMAGNITEATIDQIVAIYGATPAFSNSGSNNVAANVRDRAMANYAARRDKNDGNGLYSQMKNQFLKLKAAVKAGSKYNKERNEALAEIRLLWEKINAATIINYCHSAIANLSKTNPTDNEKASALHAYSEAVGFLHGWRTIPQNFKKITDAQIDEMLIWLNAPYNGTPTSYKFITDSVNELPKLTQVINKLRDLYGFTAQEIEDFKQNWVSLQRR